MHLFFVAEKEVAVNLFSQTLSFLLLPRNAFWQQKEKTFKGPSQQEWQKKVINLLSSMFIQIRMQYPVMRKKRQESILFFFFSLVATFQNGLPKKSYKKRASWTAAPPPPPKKRTEKIASGNFFAIF